MFKERADDASPKAETYPPFSQDPRPIEPFLDVMEPVMKQSTYSHLTRPKESSSEIWVPTTCFIAPSCECMTETLLVR